VPNQDPRVEELHLGIPLHDWVSAFCTSGSRHHHHQRSGNRMGCAELWSVLRFRSWPLWRVSCYTLLSGCQPSWPPTRYPKQPASLNGAHMSLHLDILETISVHPASPVLLTSKGPQKTQAIRPHTLRWAHHPFIPQLWERRKREPRKKLPADLRQGVLGLSTARPLGGSSRDCSSRGAGNATLRLSQFEDRLRRRPSQGVPLLHCSSLGNFCWGPSIGHDPPQMGPFFEQRRCEQHSPRCNWALAILRETSRETSY